MNKSSLYQPVRCAYFWVPTFLAVLDLAFYALVPLILLSIFATSSDITDGIISYFLSLASRLLALDLISVLLTIVFLIIVLRIFGTKVAERVFASSVAKNYKQESAELLDRYLALSAHCMNTDLSKVRKAINAEVSNVFFGFRVPTAFIAAESILVLTIIAYASFLFGAKVLLFAVAVGTTVFFILHFIRKKSASVGQARSTFEQQRLDLTEVALNSAFSISVNGGQQYLIDRFNFLTQNFAYALGQQVVLPYSTKALIDGTLVVFVFLLLTQGGFSYSPSDMAILGGMVVRAIPSLSRISSYVETMRINAVALSELAVAVDSTRLPAPVRRNEDLHDALASLPGTGMFFVVGASGIGKTTTIKDWITELSGKKSVAYLEQAGFVSGTSIIDYFELVGLDCEARIETEQWLAGYGIKGHRIAHLSGGQAKFLQFAALSHKQADVYVFDEPSVGLDAELQEITISILAKLSKNALVVAVSHDRVFIDSLMQKTNGKVLEVS
jgi:hypothetical protein